MAAESRYWRLVRLDTTGKCKAEEIVPARKFFQQQFRHLVGADASDILIQRQLLSIIKAATVKSDASQSPSSPVKEEITSNSLMAELCLRCFISSQIYQVCIQLETQFGRKYGFSRKDLVPFVLDDNGTSVESSYQSLAKEILHTFDPERSSLATWTTRLVKHRQELNKFLLERGVYLVSDWAILNDTKSKQVKRIFAEFHHLSESEIQLACVLLESYHAVYRRDRLEQRRNLLKSGQSRIEPCLPPTSAQLHEIAQLVNEKATLRLRSEQVMTQLQALAQRLREYRIYARGGLRTTASLDEPKNRLKLYQIQSFNSVYNCDTQDEQTEFLKFYRQQFIDCLDRAIEQVIRECFASLQRKDGQIAEQFIKALKLFYCQGLSMSKIAREVGLQAQYQVTRLLKLKHLRTNIGARMLENLCHCIMDEARAYANPMRLQTLEQEVEVALEQQILTVIQEAEAEAHIAKIDVKNSLFAQRLRRHLDKTWGYQLTA